MGSRFPYRYGPRRDKAVQQAHKLRGIFEGTRSFVIETWVLCGLLDELSQQTHLARQYDRALRADCYDQVQKLLTVAARDGRKAVNAGKRGADPLLWALVPLYLLRKTHGPLPLNGADVARFWLKRGIWRTPGTVTGALWRHIGYARHISNRPRPSQGWVITPNGEKYVEAALAAKRGRRG